ncbi:MAG: DHH family phosphoesterase [bacterium]
MSTLLYKQIKDQIDRAEHILLLTDERIDGDTLGSTLGMYHVLREMGKRVDVFSPKPISDSLKFIPGVEVIQTDDKVFEVDGIDLVMIFDCSDGVCVMDRLPKMKRRVPLIAIDHHTTNPGYGDINLVEPEASSAADVVWRFIKFAKYPVNADAAQAILTGICTDTIIFSTTSTNSASLEAAVELTKLGAKLQEIVRRTMMNQSVAALKLWGMAFERLHRNEEFGAVATAITRRDLRKIGALEEELVGLVSFIYTMLDGADVTLVLRETDDGGVKGSLRSTICDVAELAARRGGGGHKNAAGFKVQNARLVEKDGVWEIVTS